MLDSRVSRVSYKQRLSLWRLVWGMTKSLEQQRLEGER
jgi:hypothetical protein